MENGGAEQRPSDWIAAIKKCYFDLITVLAFDSKKITAVNCTAQWSGTVAVDEKGDPLMNSIIWMDSRGAEHIAKLNDGLLKVDGYHLLKTVKWIRSTGGAPSSTGKDSLAQYPEPIPLLEGREPVSVWFVLLDQA